jgi:hypothetical protein
MGLARLEGGSIYQETLGMSFQHQSCIKIIVVSLILL